MGSLNKVMLIGNIGRDPEVRTTNDGKQIANLSLATTDRWKDSGGAQQEKTEWHKVVVFGNLADVVQKYVKKGDPVYFEGKLQTRKWTDKDGQEKYTTEVVVDQRGVMQMLGSRGSGSGASRGGDDQSMPSDMPPPASKMKPAKATSDAPFDDDIPF